MAMAWVDKNGGSATKVKFVEIPFPNMEAALVAGKVDAISIQEPFAAVAARKAGNAGPVESLGRCFAEVFDRQLVRIGKMDSKE